MKQTDPEAEHLEAAASDPTGADDRSGNTLDLDADLAVTGDRAALERVLAQIHPVIVRYCRTRLSDGHRSLVTPDDIAQEVCMAVISALPTYRREGRPFLAFVYGICHHKVADAHRAGGRSRSQPFAEVPDSVATDRTPEQVAVQGSVTASMNELLTVLPEQQREILRLRIGVGLSADQTAQALGMSAGAVRVAQHRALAKLRTVLANDDAWPEQLL
ncbi:RNA polymerase sigma factor ShbA [Nakamurella sp. YIM 132084]|uniref:RNA polymerase sigma factor ShbA n=2 Tax=Nakamurella leprariae TaxID=2803911 RepID=A0A938YD08_9ACTN|nr:RNA polymerase sigma factor ShbA [Nakamurella leprariae]